jgi:hypothetical protein
MRMAATVFLFLVMVLAAVWNAPPASAQADHSSSDGKAIMEKADREVPRPRPAIHDGIRYEAVRNARMRGFDQAGGIVVAIDEATGKDLWTLKVYDVIFEIGEERDAQDVFITRLRVDADGRRLKITDERKRVFLVDLATRTVTAPAR